MIEVELKFVMNEDARRSVVAASVFQGTQKHDDICYDTADYGLSLNNWWLRSRNGHYTLKIPALVPEGWVMGGVEDCPRLEIEDEEEIAAALKMPARSGPEPVSFHQRLAEAGYTGHYRFSTVREKYTCGPLTIDMDTAFWQGHVFPVCEVEQCVAQVEQVPHAREAIEAFARHHGLETGTVEAKLFSVIRLQNPEHYARLMDL
jgi:adenylate cyclase class IV